MARIGEEVSERLEFVPASVVVIEEVRGKYACACGGGVKTADKPPQPIEKGLAGASLLAQVAVSKYADHCPLHRQEGIFQRHGVDLSRKTMWGWMRGTADLLQPLYERLKAQALASKVVQTDDTPVPVLDPDLPKTRTDGSGPMWATRTIRRSCTITRRRENATGRMSFWETIAVTYKRMPMPAMTPSIRRRSAASRKSDVTRTRAGSSMRRGRATWTAP